LKHALQKHFCNERQQVADRSSHTPERRRDQILAYMSTRDRSSVGELRVVLGVVVNQLRKRGIIVTLV
jgi:hypothetical protein